MRFRYRIRLESMTLLIIRDDLKLLTNTVLRHLKDILCPDFRHYTVWKL